MESNKIICEHCLEVFSSRNKLFQHIRSTHNKFTVILKQIEALQSSLLPALQSNSTTNQMIYSNALTSHDIHQEIITAYEDEHFKAVIKPQGLCTMGENPSLLRHDSLLLPGALNNPEVPYKKAVPCHRLDKDTGGLVICSKSFAAEKNIRESFRAKLIQKRYRAIVIGRVGLSAGFGRINHPIRGKPAESLCQVVCYTNSSVYGCLTTLNLWPVTGKKHQLRKHMQAIGHPILGDRIYLYSADWPSTKDDMCLWAVEVVLPHPLTSSLPAAKSIMIPDLRDSDDEGDDDHTEENSHSGIVGKKMTIHSHRHGIIVPIESLSTHDFDEWITQAYHRRLSTAFGCEVTAVDEIASLLSRIVIPEPLYYEAIRQAHEQFFNIKATSEIVS